MADTIIITDQDRADAENILQQFLSDKMPNGDFGRGNALRDLTITGMAYTFAYLRREIDITRARQSLLLLSKLTGTEIDDAVDEILSNWFLTRKVGRNSTGIATVYLTQQVDVNVPITSKFYRGNLVFVPDAIDTVTIAKEDLTRLVDSNGVVVGYSFNILLKAQFPGEDYNIEAGAFTDFTRFSPYVTRVENQNAFSGGKGNETTTEMLDRASTAISVRDLNSPRSIDVTLRDEFTTVDDVTVIGMGDPEMIRDLILEEATNTRIHGGGHVDAYLRSPILSDMVFTGTVGGAFTDPREGYFILRDDTVADFVAAGVEAGHMIRIHNVIGPSEGDLYVVKQVTPYGLYVSQRTPFPKALPTVLKTVTDGILSAATPTRVTSAGEYTFTADDVGRYIRIASPADANNIGTGLITAVDPGGTYAVVSGFNPFTDESGVAFSVETRIVEYTVGGNAPLFNDKISNSGNPKLTGMFTKSIQKDARVVLPGWPIYRISDVSLPGTGLDPSWLSADGKMHFTHRVNRTPVWTPGAFEYQVVCQNPPEGSSGWQVMELNIGHPTGEAENYFNGKTLTVVFDTLTGYDSVWAMMTSTDRRIICGSVIPKGLHPVYLSMNIPYRLSKIATQDIDPIAAAAALTDFINNFDTRDTIDVSDIITFLRSTYSQLGYVEPFQINYELLAPDGRVIKYVTSGEVIVTPAYADPASVLPEDLLADPLGIGVSGNTLRFLTVSSLITFTNLGS